MSDLKKAPASNLALFIAVTGVALGTLLTALHMRLEGGAIAVLGFALLYIRLDRTCMPGFLLGPSIFVFLYHALGYALGPLAQRYILQSEHFIEEGMVLSQWGAVLGLATYLLVFPRVFRTAHDWAVGKTEQTEATPRGHSWPGYTLVLLAITLAILLYGYLTEVSRRMGGLPMDAPIAAITVVTAFGAVRVIVFFFLGFLAAKQRGAWMGLWLICCLAYVVFQTLEGNRGLSIDALLMSVMGAVWAGASAKKAVLALGLSALLFIPVSGIVEWYRGYTTYTYQYDEGFGARVSAFIEAAQELNTINRAGWHSSNEAFIYAVSALTVDRVMVLTPGIIPYAGFENLDALLYVFIPKVFFPDRPELADANLIAFRYGVGSGDNTSFVYIPAVGEGYRRFGWVGIPIIYALSSVIFGLWTGISWAKRARREWTALLVFLVYHAPVVWSATFNSAIHFATFYVLKYYIFLSGLRILQDGLALLLGVRQPRHARWRAPVKHNHIGSRPG